MAGSTDFDEEDGITGINVTPLVDIMLVLLIIFMVASNYIVQESIEIKLPKAATGEETNTKNQSIALIIKADGSLYLDGKVTSLEAIAKRSQSLANVDNAQALIAADRATSHGDVIKIIDLVRANGLMQFSINIDPENDPIVDQTLAEEMTEDGINLNVDPAKPNVPVESDTPESP